MHGYVRFFLSDLNVDYSKKGVKGVLNVRSLEVLQDNTRTLIKKQGRDA